MPFGLRGDEALAIATLRTRRPSLEVDLLFCRQRQRSCGKAPSSLALDQQALRRGHRLDDRRVGAEMQRPDVVAQVGKVIGGDHAVRAPRAVEGIGSGTVCRQPDQAQRRGRVDERAITDVDMLGREGLAQAVSEEALREAAEEGQPTSVRPARYFGS